MLFYHGTSYESFLNIIKEGFNPQEKTWVCSEVDTTYFYGLNDFRECDQYGCKENHHTEECTEFAQFEAIRMSGENGKIAAAIKGSKKDIIIVIEYEADSNEVEKDESCENMEGAYSIYDADKNKIKRIFSIGYFPDLRPFYLVGVYANNLFNSKAIPQVLNSAIEILSNSDCYIDEIHECDYEEKDIKSFVA